MKCNPLENKNLWVHMLINRIANEELNTGERGRAFAFMLECWVMAAIYGGNNRIGKSSFCNHHNTLAQARTINRYQISGEILLSSIFHGLKFLGFFFPQIYCKGKSSHHMEDKLAKDSTGWSKFASSLKSTVFLNCGALRRRQHHLCSIASGNTTCF